MLVLAFVLPLFPTVETVLQYKFKDQARLWGALQAAGRSTDSVGQPVAPDGHKRLAVVGDAAIKLSLVEDWYATNAIRGQVNIGFSEMATNNNLDLVGKKLGLDEHVQKAPGMLGVPPRTMADTMEAILGAVYFDGGIQSVKEVMRATGLVPRQPNA